MKRNKLANSLLLIAATVLMSGGQAYAKNAGSKGHQPGTEVNPTQSPNLRQQTPHTNRKEAARRLKAAHNLARVHGQHNQGQQTNTGGAQ